MTDIEVAIIEDNKEYQDVLRIIVGGTNGFRAQYTYSNGRAALSGIRHDPPDVVLVDLNLPDISGVECIQQLKDEFPRIQFLVISSSEDEELIFKALTAGAEGYLTKQTSPAKIIELLEELVNGGAPMSSSIARQLIKFFNHPDKELAETYQNVLTKREQEVLTWLIQGITYDEIGKKMSVGREAIKSHCSNIYRKLQVTSKDALIRKFYKNNPLVFRLEIENRNLKMEIERLEQEIERLKVLQ